MASEITHVVLTEKVYNKFFSKFDKKKFFQGTLFPDINKIAHTDRITTHIHENITLKQIQSEKDSFIAGFKFHSLLDNKRFIFLTKKGIYDLLNNIIHPHLILCFVEDEILHSKIKDYSIFFGFIKEISEDEKKQGFSQKDLEKWHKILEYYLTLKPSEKLREKFHFKSLTPEQFREVNENIKNVKNNPEIIKIVNELYDNFEQIIQEE